MVMQCTPRFFRFAKVFLSTVVPLCERPFEKKSQQIDIIPVMKNDKRRGGAMCSETKLSC